MTRETYNGEIKLQWHGFTPDEELHAKVVENIRLELSYLDQPSDLIFHTYFIGPTLDDASVFVWGEPGSDFFHCEYSPTTEFVSLKEEHGDGNDV